MLKQMSENLKEIFIFEFTKELIKSTGKYKEELIKNEVKRILQKKLEIRQEPPIIQKKEIKDIVKEKLMHEKERVFQLKKEENLFLPKFKTIKKIPQTPLRQITRSAIRRPIIAKPIRSIPPPRFSIAPLKIPEPYLPETVQHLRPIPTDKEIDLGKLNPLIKDPLVKTIEYSSANEKIIVTGGMGRKPTSIVLTKEEADEIINRFSHFARIPIHEGFFRVAIGRLVLSAIVSNIDSIGSKFIIQKLSDQRAPAPYRR